MHSPYTSLRDLEELKIFVMVTLESPAQRRLSVLLPLQGQLTQTAKGQRRRTVCDKFVVATRKRVLEMATHPALGHPHWKPFKAVTNSQADR